jgi:hypothetical protein
VGFGKEAGCTDLSILGRLLEPNHNEALERVVASIRSPLVYGVAEETSEAVLF